MFMQGYMPTFIVMYTYVTLCKNIRVSPEKACQGKHYSLFACNVNAEEKECFITFTQA